MGFKRQKPDKTKHANGVKMKPLGVLKTKTRQNKRNKRRTDEVIYDVFPRMLYWFVFDLIIKVFVIMAYSFVYNYFSVKLLDFCLDFCMFRTSVSSRVRPLSMRFARVDFAVFFKSSSVR